MNTLIISDIHGSYQQLEKVLSTPHAFETLILVGDSLYHGPRNPILKDYNPQKVADLLNAISVSIIAVRGNCDAEVDQMLLDFPMMQDYSQLHTETHSFFITHGHIIEPKDAHTTKADVFISGHTHVPGFNDLNGTLCFNPGSISLPKEGHPPTYGMISNDTLTIYTLDHQVYLQHNL